MAQATSRYPLDISTSLSTYMIITRAKNKGFSTTELRNISDKQFKSRTISAFALPVPDGIVDNSNISYTNIEDSSVLAQAGQAIANKIAGASVQQEAKIKTAQTKAIQSMMLFDSVSLKSFAMNWKLVPESKEEMDNIETIIKEIELGKLPDYASNEIMNFPDVFTIGFGGVKPKLLVFLPCVITSVSVTYGDGEFQMYNDGGFPSITLSVGFAEIAGRTRQIQQALYDSFK